MSVVTGSLGVPKPLHALSCNTQMLQMIPIKDQKLLIILLCILGDSLQMETKGVRSEWYAQVSIVLSIFPRNVSTIV
jgi:hypothetical protein